MTIHIMKEIDNILEDKEYLEWIQQLVQRYRSSQIKAAIKVNEAMLRYYWSLGKDIVEKKAESRWGDGFLKRLSYDLHHRIPSSHGFSVTNLTYMKYFYSTYNQCFAIYPQLGDKLEKVIFSIPWGHHKILVDHFKKQPEKAVFFAQKIIENGWSRPLLQNFVSTDLYERSGKAITNFSTTLPSPDSSIAQEVLKDPYNFDFLTLTEDYKEKDLKTGKFQPEFISKLNFYCTAVNHLIKGPDDGDTIGLLICKEKNDLVAQWTVEKNQWQPLGISSYELTKLYPKEISQTLPSIEDIENELKDKQ